MKITFGKRVYSSVDRRELIRDFQKKALGNYLENSADLEINRVVLSRELTANLNAVMRRAAAAVGQGILGRAKSPQQAFQIFSDQSGRTDYGYGAARLERIGNARIIFDGVRNRSSANTRMAAKLNAQLTLQWTPLALRTTERKPTSSALSYFVDTGELQAFFAKQARQRSGQLGTLKLFSLGGGTSGRDALGRFARQDSPEALAAQPIVPLDSVLITLLPDVSRGMLPALFSGNFEATDASAVFETAIGLGAIMQSGSRGRKPRSVLDKLRGREEYHRPLVQPIYSYYLRVEAPAAVQAAVHRAIQRKK